MTSSKPRRSCRVALSLPIRVFGVDFRGIDFTEEALTTLVNLHGAKIRLSHQLMPDAEIRLVSHATGQDAIFRVVSKVQSAESKFTYWGVESLDPQKNIWGVEIPHLVPAEGSSGEAELECPSCFAQRSFAIDQELLLLLQEKGGVERTCTTCGKPGIWKLSPSEAT